MRVSIVTSMAGAGGTENVSLRLATLLSRRGHSVSILSGPGPLVDVAIASGVQHVCVDFYAPGIRAFVRSVLAIFRFLKRSGVDVLHCQMARPVVACVAANILAGSPAKVVWHSRGLRAKTYPVVCRLFPILGVYAIANCMHERNKLVRHGFPAGRVSYTYNPLPDLHPSESRSVGSALVLGSLSRLSPDRSVDEAIYILSELHARGIAARLRIAGDGPEMPALRALSDRLGVRESVDFLGSTRDLVAFFGTIDVLINTPKLHGDDGAGVGNNILEAGLAEVPVVTYSSCGVSEVVVDGVTGFCVPVGQRDLFVTALLDLSQDRAQRKLMGDALRRRVIELCSDDAIYDATLGAYRRALDKS